MGTSQAIRVWKSEVSNFVIKFAPDLFLIKFFQLDSISPPRGVTAPIPETTTLRNLKSYCK